LKGKHKKECKDDTCKGCARGYVTMKGFPRSVRTPENLKKLRAGESVTFQNLEKVRTLARLGFRRPPQMAGEVGPDGKRWLHKAFRSAYDKRVLLCDVHGEGEQFITEKKGRSVKSIRTGLFLCGCDVGIHGMTVPVVVDDTEEKLDEAAQ